MGAVVKLSSRSPSPNRVAAELALDRALHGVKVNVATHIPGVANTVADALFRLGAPERKELPAVLAGVRHIVFPVRDNSWFSALWVSDYEAARRPGSWAPGHPEQEWAVGLGLTGSWRRRNYG